MMRHSGRERDGARSWRPVTIWRGVGGACEGVGVIVTRRFPIALIIAFGVRMAGMAALWAAVVWFAYARLGLTFLRVPFLPIATVGTAVAFYVGFKNNAAYERFWEGRKIWGGIVNTSRTWTSAIISYVQPGDESEEAYELRRGLIYRQLAWINALRLQLRRKSRFFDKPSAGTRRRLERHDAAMRNDWDSELEPFLDADELEASRNVANAASHLLLRQGQVLADLVRRERLDLFHQIDLMKSVEELYALQGKCERIKNTPFPRQYAEYSRVFTRVFALLVPFGLLDVFAGNTGAAAGAQPAWATVIPMVLSSSLVTWVFTTMEGIGDASEDPFERSMNDVPMNALCRTIEIDARQMLGEDEVPSPEQPIDMILY
jgi:ion channel-forming bestrophin family protein